MFCHQIFPPHRNLFADLINEFLLILAWKFEIVMTIGLPQTTEENSITYLSSSYEFASSYLALSIAQFFNLDQIFC